jgi:hypothetical protein
MRAKGRNRKCRVTKDAQYTMPGFETFSGRFMAALALGKLSEKQAALMVKKAVAVISNAVAPQ